MEPQLYEVPAGKHLRVHEGDRVRAGDRLTEGPVNPHDILLIKGPRAVQEYLLNEVQEVYRLQGVRISDKHIGVIVRQMLQKVRVTDPGDTDFLEGETVDKLTFRDENERVIKRKGTPAQAEPVLLGITKASLTTQSFISAASFQETTRVLTDAAIRGAKDDLLGLKENIIIGHLIPAGSGHLPVRRDRHRAAGGLRGAAAAGGGAGAAAVGGGAGRRRGVGRSRRTREAPGSYAHGRFVFSSCARSAAPVHGSTPSRAGDRHVA